MGNSNSQQAPEKEDISPEPEKKENISPDSETKNGISSEMTKAIVDTFRQNRDIFRNCKKNYRELLETQLELQNSPIQEGFMKYISENLNPERDNENNTPIDPKEMKKMKDEYIKRFDNVETIVSILKSPMNNEKLVKDFEEKENSGAPLNTMPIKLYVAEPPQHVKDKKFEGLSKIAIENQFVGLFGPTHAALQIGDKIIHFFENSFVKIDSFKARQALLLMNISKSGRIPSTDEVLTVIAEIIIEWNKNAVYSETLLNCQDFVEDMCKQLNSKCKLTGENKLGLSFDQNIKIKNYLEDLRKNPEKSGFYILYGKNQEKKEFTSHRELDEWELEMNEKNELTGDELALLKGFHRAYQLRFEAAKIDENITLYKRYESGPYGCTRGNATRL